MADTPRALQFARGDAGQKTRSLPLLLLFTLYSLLFTLFRPPNTFTSLMLGPASVHQNPSP